MPRPKPALPLRARLAKLLGSNEPPRRVAASFSVALFCGTAPLFLGAFLLLPLVKLLRLSKFVAIGVTALLMANPLGVVVMLGQTWLGFKLMGKPVPDWKTMGDSMKKTWDALKWQLGAASAPPADGESALTFLWAFLVGGYAGSLGAAALLYGAILGWLTWRRGTRDSGSRATA